MVTQRFAYIDIAKGLGILMVVWGHIASHWTSAFVYTFHMPLFFFISGMLFNRNKYPMFGDFLKARAKRLLVPYLLYSVVTWAVWAVFSYLKGMPVVDILAPLTQTVLAKGSGQFFVYNSPLWFIPCLLAVEIMYFFSSRFCDWLNMLICIILMLISVLFEHRFGNGYLLLLPWNFDAALMALPLYAFGNLLVKHFSLSGIYQFVEKHRVASLAGVVACAAFIYVSLDIFPNISMGYSYYGNEWIFHLRALIGIAMVLTVSILIETIQKNHSTRGGMLDWCGHNSLDIMCTHVPIKGILAVIAAKFLGMSVSDTKSTLIVALAVFVVTMGIDYILVSLINKFIRRA